MKVIQSESDDVRPVFLEVIPRMGVESQAAERYEGVVVEIGDPERGS